MRQITFDLETRNIFSDVGSNDPTALDISVVCIHDSADNSFKSFTEKDLRNLWPILESADALITWNGDHFDIPILNKYYPGDLTRIKSIDLMKEVQTVLGRRLKLDTVAQATLGTKKSGHGLDAIEWWNKGEIAKIIEYCTDDVRITRELYDYAVRNKKLKYTDGNALKEIALNINHWEIPVATALTYTLPF